MRLLDVYNFEVQSGFPDQDLADARSRLWHLTPSATAHTPKYAILSHRWIGDEVTFQDFQALPKSQFRNPPARNPVPLILNDDGSPQNAQGNLSSIFKIAGACNQVRETNDEAVPHIRHIWIDTVCINKAESQELSASINSMFHWYQNAEVCYVYLFDVSWDGANDSIFRQQFVRSQWFVRGWTLQELLAPNHLDFFDRDWKYIGSKGDLVTDIAVKTGIQAEYILGSFRSASLGQKMSWLAYRTTERIEDRAYCMLGIFGIYLEARYGQGEAEFLRLQEEIVKSWDKRVPFDESLFAWTAEEIESSGLLAPAPGCFKNAGDIIFDSKVAKRRVIGLADGIDAAKQINFTVPLSVPLPPIAGILSLGSLMCITVYPAMIYHGNRHHREMKLNCWTKRADGRLNAVKIRMERTPDKTWQRVDCGRLYASTWPKLYLSSWAAFTILSNLRISHEIKYKS